MVIKLEGMELEIDEAKGIYFGSRSTGRVFKRWTDLDPWIRQHLKGIVKTTRGMLHQTQAVLNPRPNTPSMQRFNNERNVERRALY